MIDSTDPIFQVYNRVPNILIVISIVPFTEVFEYQFYIDGPTPANSKTMPFTDININQTYQFNIPA